MEGAKVITTVLFLLIAAWLAYLATTKLMARGTM